MRGGHAVDELGWSGFGRVGQIHTFEHVIELMGPNPEQQSWVWISDFNGECAKYPRVSPILYICGGSVRKPMFIQAPYAGFGLRNLNPAIALHANKLFSTYYAERLGCFMLLGAPRIFSGLYNVLTPVLDPTTKHKLMFVDRTAEVRSSSHPTLGPVLLADLVLCMAPKLVLPCVPALQLTLAPARRQ